MVLNKEELENFTGTENYYSSSFGKLKLTDGMNYLRNEANCYWLIDIVESVLGLEKIKENMEFIVWRIVVNKDKSFKVAGYRDSPFNEDTLLYEQIGTYTDFPFGEFEFYQVNDVLLLKSEY